MSSTLDGLSASVDDFFRELREKFREASKEAGIWESLQAFAAAVDWTVGTTLHLTGAIACSQIDCEPLISSCLLSRKLDRPSREGSLIVGIVNRSHGSLGCLRPMRCSC